MCITNQLECESNHDHPEQPSFQPKQQKLYIGTCFDKKLNDNLIKILKIVYDHKDAWAFRAPVDEQYAPNYYKLIQNPMDLGEMLNRAESQLYADLETLERDFVQMILNCEQYNGASSPYTQYAHNLWKCFARCVRLHLNRSLNVDEKTTFRYAPLAPSCRNRKRRARLIYQKSRMQALQTLFDATQDSIRDTFAQSAVNLSSPLVHSDQWQETQDLQQMIQRAQPENLIFKRLNEWQELIQASGHQVILPEEAVQVIESPISSSWLSNYPEEQQHLKYSTLLFGRLTHPSTRSIGQRVKCDAESWPQKYDREFSEDNDKSKNASNTYQTSSSTEAQSRHDPKTPARLVIKLSRKNNDWKPVDCKRKSSLIDSYRQSNRFENQEANFDLDRDSKSNNCFNQDNYNEDGDEDDNESVENDAEHNHNSENKLNEFELSDQCKSSNHCQMSQKRNCRSENSMHSASIFRSENSFSNEHLISLYQ